MVSEAYVDGMAVEPELSSQYLFSERDRRVVWQNGFWHVSADEAKVCNWMFTCSLKSEAKPRSSALLVFCNGTL